MYRKGLPAVGYSRELWIYKVSFYDRHDTVPSAHDPDVDNPKRKDMIVTASNSTLVMEAVKLAYPGAHRMATLKLSPAQ